MLISKNAFNAIFHALSPHEAIVKDMLVFQPLPEPEVFKIGRSRPLRSKGRRMEIKSPISYKRKREVKDPGMVAQTIGKIGSFRSQEEVEIINQAQTNTTGIAIINEIVLEETILEKETYNATSDIINQVLNELVLNDYNMATFGEATIEINDEEFNNANRLQTIDEIVINDEVYKLDGQYFADEKSWNSQGSAIISDNQLISTQCYTEPVPLHNYELVDGIERCPAGREVEESECYGAAFEFRSTYPTIRRKKSIDYVGDWDYTPCGCFIWYESLINFHVGGDTCIKSHNANVVCKIKNYEIIQDIMECPAPDSNGLHPLWMLELNQLQWSLS
jgi:hypothetical protein